MLRSASRRSGAGPGENGQGACPCVAAAVGKVEHRGGGQRNRRSSEETEIANADSAGVGDRRGATGALTLATGVKCAASEGDRRGGRNLIIRAHDQSGVTIDRNAAGAGESRAGSIRKAERAAVDVSAETVGARAGQGLGACAHFVYDN